MPRRDGEGLTLILGLSRRDTDDLERGQGRVVDLTTFSGDPITQVVVLFKASDHDFDEEFARLITRDTHHVREREEDGHGG